jgi:hypothetical protein
VYWDFTCSLMNVQEYVAGIGGTDSAAIEDEIELIARREIDGVGATAVLVPALPPTKVSPSALKFALSMRAPPASMRADRDAHLLQGSSTRCEFARSQRSDAQIHAPHQRARCDPIRT